MRSIGKTQKIVFLAHWVENWNWLLWWMKDLHQDPNKADSKWYLAPVYYVMSICYLIGKQGHDVVDRFMVRNQAYGEIWLLRNFAWHFLGKSSQARIYHRILEAVLDAQSRGATVIGLGALTKAEWLTAGGKRIVDDLGNRLGTPIVHGDTLTAATVVKQAERLIRLHHLEESPVFVTGATSKIGRAIVLSLVASGHKVLMLSESALRVEEIRREAGEAAAQIHHARSYAEGRQAKLWITGKAEPGAGNHIIRFAPEAAVVLNFSVPDPLTPEFLRSRPDIMHLDGGLMRYELTDVQISFTMRLKPGLTYACHAGTMVHGLEGWTHHEVGPVDMDAIWTVWQCAEKHGFSLPHWTSHLKPVEVKPKLEVVGRRAFAAAATG